MQPAAHLQPPLRQKSKTYTKLLNVAKNVRIARIGSLSQKLVFADNIPAGTRTLKQGPVRDRKSIL